MNFELTDDQKLLVDSVRDFVRNELPVGHLRALRDDAVGYSKKTWKQMGELGWLGVPFPETYGGHGWGAVEIGLILEQLGSTLVPEPYVPSIVLGGMAVLRAGSEAQKQRWLRPLIAGEITLALAYLEEKSRHHPRQVATRAAKAGERFRLHGRKIFVLNGHAAEAMIVTAHTAAGGAEAERLELFLVEAGAPGLAVESVRTIDGHHAAMVSFEGCEAERLAGQADAGAVIEALCDFGAAAACAEGYGIMRAALEMTVGYLCTREQFGVKIGSFQALQHRAVDMFVEAELAHSTAMLAAIKLDDPDTLERQSAISAAKVQLATSGRFVTQQAIQLHGGIGCTDEHDIGLYFKRMHVLNSLFGDEEYHLARYANLPSFVGI